MVRINDKVQLVNYENSIQKSNEFSMAKLNVGLSLNQMQLFAYAIYRTQQNGKTDFHKADFEKKFEIKQYRTLEAKKDAQRLTTLQFSMEDLKQDYFEFINIFGSIKYKNGLFEFKWNEEVLPHIVDLKEKYITTDLTITSKFKSSFSWTLYDYLKAHYGYWHKPITKEAALHLFGVENRKTYHSAAQFKRGVLDVAIAEINEHTEFNVWYQEEKEGRSIVGFDLHWSTGKKETAATKSQIKELHTIIHAVMDDMFTYINVSNDEDRAQAIDLVSKLRDYIKHTIEPVEITQQYAAELLERAKIYFKQLQFILERNNVQKPNKIFYNWLEERED